MMITKKCPKCGAQGMEPTSDGFTGYDSKCLICGKTLYNDKSIPAKTKKQLRRYSVISCESPSDVHIHSMLIRSTAGGTRFVFSAGRHYGATA
jgi:predicted nucleic-acid-binding Zn-ribbon protein